jgi:hypothetical protein
MGAALVPRTVEEITPAWISRALGVEVTDVAVSTTIGGTATKLLLQLEYDSATSLPSTMCLKGGFGDHAQFMAKVGIYATEARFFRDELPNSKVRAPKAFWADVNEELFGAVLLEDLSRPSVRFCSGRVALSIDEAASVLDNAALLHAGRWNSEWLTQTSWLEHFADPTSKGRAYFSMLDVAVVSEFIDKRIDILPSELTDPRHCIDLFWGFVSASEHGPQTLLHGDLHVGNVYFDGPQAAMCDWQVLGRGSPAFDLAYLIGSALDVDDRRTAERDLLRHYLGALQSAGVATAPTEDELWSAYRAHMAYGFFAWLTNPEAFQAADIIAEILARFSTAVIDLETADAVGLS